MKSFPTKLQNDVYPVQASLNPTVFASFDKHNFYNHVEVTWRGSKLKENLLARDKGGKSGTQAARVLPVNNPLLQVSFSFFWRILNQKAAFVRRPIPK